MQTKRQLQPVVAAALVRLEPISGGASSWLRPPASNAHALLVHYYQYQRRLLPGRRWNQRPAPGFRLLC